VVEPVLRYRIKLLAFVVTVLGGLLIYIVINISSTLSKDIKLIHNRRALIWFIVPISTQIIIKFPFAFGKINLKVVDQGWVEVVGAQGLFRLLSIIRKKIQK
jgi:hypothetical protein